MISNSGIYQITNKINDKFYIGSSSNMSIRWYNHKRNALLGSNKSPYLYSAMRKYGVENFEIKVIIVCEKNSLEKYEQHFLDKFYGMIECYNASPNATAPWRGRKMSVEARQKLSQSCMGRVPWNKGIKRTDAEKKKISDSTKKAMSKIKIVVSEKTKNKLSKALTGKKRSSETRLKMSLAKQGKETWNKDKPHPTSAKLTESQVREIKNKYIPFKYGFKRLSLEYQVSPMTIDAIITGRTWRHVQ